MKYQGVHPSLCLLRGKVIIPNDWYQIKDLRHPDDTSIRVTADDVNFVTNAEYVYCT